MTWRYLRQGPACKGAMLTAIAVSAIACSEQEPPTAIDERPMRAPITAPSLPDDDRAEVSRLDTKRQSLQALVVELNDVIGELNKQQARAKSLEKQLADKKRALNNDARVAAALAKAQALADQKGGPRDDLKRRARHIDQELSRLGAREKASAKDGQTTRALKQQVTELQRSVQQLAPGAKVAFRALTMMIQTELALEQL